MRKFLLFPVVCLLLFGGAACHKNKSDLKSDFPADFANFTDEQRMEYIMKRAEPDSVARFLFYATLGKIPGVRIDTLANANLYVLETYQGEDLERFVAEFKGMQQTLSLSDMLEFGLITGDTLTVGYEMGLNYVARIRDRQMKIKQIDQEMAEFRKTCGADTATYTRFLKGFREALKLDRGRDIPAGVFERYSLQENVQ